MAMTLTKVGETPTLKVEGTELVSRDRDLLHEVLAKEADTEQFTLKLVGEFAQLAQENQKIAAKLAEAKTELRASSESHKQEVAVLTKRAEAAEERADSLQKEMVEAAKKAKDVMDARAGSIKQAKKEKANAADKSFLKRGYNPKKLGDSEIEKLVDYTIALVKESSQIFDIEKKAKTLPKNAVILVGPTGVGKTTLINAIAGNGLQAHFDDKYGRTIIEAVEPVEDFLIGHEISSETIIPHNIVTKDDVTGELITVWDFPGIGDNRGIAQQISNVLVTQELVKFCSNLKILVTVDYDALTDSRGIAIMEVISLFERLLLGNIDSILPSISLVVSHSRSDFTAKAAQKNIQDIIDALGLEGTQKGKILQALKGDKDNNSITIFSAPKEIDDPNEVVDLDVKSIRKNILDNVRKTTYAQNVSINPCLSEDASNIALNAYNKLAQKIEENVDRYLKEFLDSVNSYADVCKRSKFQDKLTIILEKLKAIMSIEHDMSHLDEMVKKCDEIAMICCKILPNVKEYIEKLSPMSYLEKFIDDKAHIPLKIIDLLKDRVSTCITLIERAQLELSTLDKKERAEREAEIKKAEDERKCESEHRSKVYEKMLEQSREEARLARQRMEEIARSAAGGGSGGCTLL